MPIADDADVAPPDLDAGFTRVDDQPDPERLTSVMDETARWPSVIALRAWERERLAVVAGDRVLDVGCGLGDVATDLAAAVAPGGEVVGIDASESMLEVARGRVPDDRPVRFAVGDATAIDHADGAFDACRSERMLQWVDDPASAIAEMCRVLRPGGRLVVTDTDWRTFALDLPDVEAAAAVTGALGAFRGEATATGGRLLNLCRDAGLVDVDVTAVGHVWTAWDVDGEVSPPGLLPLPLVLPQLVDAGLLERPMMERFLADLEAAARADRFCLTVTMLAVSGRTPEG